MSALAQPQRPLLCEHCHEPINRDRLRCLFVVNRSADPFGPFALQVQPANFLVGDDEIVFDSITCVKKWLLEWVDKAATQFMKAGRA